jgi:hypothetical protein
VTFQESIGLEAVEPESLTETGMGEQAPAKEIDGDPSPFPPNPALP